MRVWRWAGLALAIPVLVLAGFVLAARGGWLKPREADLRARYALPNSRFVQIAGQEVHLVDEGPRGAPAILLVHGSFASLRMWDAWAAALAKHYRVVRFDRAGDGLTGPSPDGYYDRIAEERVLGGVADALGLDRLVLVAVSSGGEAAGSWAAHHPERVRGVIFNGISAAPMPPPVAHQPSLSFRVALAVTPWLGGWTPRALWRGVLEANILDHRRVTPALVREWTDLVNRTQGWPRKPPREVQFATAPKDLLAIHAPALVLWGALDHDTTLAEHGRPAFALLGTQDKQLQLFPRCGHILVLDCPDASLAAAEAFLARIAPPGR